MRRAPVLWAVGGTAVGLTALVAPRLLGTFWVSNIIQILVLGLFALSVAFLVGHVGMLPLGQAAFFAAGAYGTAWLQVVAGQPVLVSALGGLIFAFLLSVLFSFAVRTQGVYFLLLTLALGMIVWGVANRWTSVTRGENGIGGVVLPTVGGINLSALRYYYYVVLVVVGLCMVAYYQMVRSPFGLTLRGIRDSESRMRTLGYNVTVHKLVAFIIAGTIAGLAGVLYVYWNNFVSPPTASLIRSAEAKLAAIIGGPTTILGSYFGAGVITLIRNYVSAEVDRYMTVMGFVFVAAALFFPRGLFGRRPRPTLRAVFARGDSGAPQAGPVQPNRTEDVPPADQRLAEKEAQHP